MKTGLITGAPGQDATWLSNLLLDKGYRVVCTYRYSSTDFNTRFQNYPINNPNFSTECCDIIDPSACINLVSKYCPDEIYNLAAASHVGESFKNPSTVFDINTKAVVNWLEAIRQLDPSIRFLQASTSEMWGSNYSIDGNVKYQDENTPFSGNSPYAVAKIAAHNMVKLYRESYDLFCCSSICHNHESKFRGENFVTRKISKYVGRLDNFFGKSPRKYMVQFTDNHIHFGLFKMDKLRLGNIDAVRDWSHANDFMRGMWMMLQADEPDDYVLSSETGRTVREFLSAAFNEIGIEDYQKYYVVDPLFYRPCEVEFLQGRSAKAREKLGWTPQISFKDLVKEMVEFDKSSNKMTIVWGPDIQGCEFKKG